VRKLSDKIVGLSEHILLTEDQKANLSRELGIILDGDLFDPRFDYVFKRIFTADGEKSKLALISFLNAALGLTGDNVLDDLTVINAEIPVEDKRQKKSVFDIRVVFKNGEQAVVEMEFSPKDDFKKRSQYLISKAYASQPLSGAMYRDLKKRYIICITNFTLFPHKAIYFDNYLFRDKQGEPLTDDQTIIFIELSKIDGLLDVPVDNLNDVDMWAIFLRYASERNKRNVINQILNRKEGIHMAAQILEEISKDELERMIYEDQLLYEADRLAEWSYRERTVREEAIESNSMEIARSLKSDNFPLDKISKHTGISLEVLQSL
jgi:predicted transposase/invertase (TIGR01784 family)